ncbi:MAG: archaeosortase/exosortase family protein [Saprospiraceae bacterium]|nr:archaeosortase/exosortase family protein [Saprospiraceae bacterium]
MIRIWILFIGILIALLLLPRSTTYQNTVEKPIGGIYSSLAAVVLNLFGYNLEKTEDTELSGPQFSMNVSKGCDAVAPMIMLITAITLYPSASIRKKFKGIAIGCALLFALNLLRIVSLYLIGIHANSWFDFFHVEFWQAIFIFIALLYFVNWIRN